MEAFRDAVFAAEASFAEAALNAETDFVDAAFSADQPPRWPDGFVI